MAKRRRRKLGTAVDVSYTGFDGLFGLSALAKDLKDDAMDAAVMGGAGAAALLASELLIPRIPWLKDQSPYLKAAAQALLGFAGGVAVGRYVHAGAGAGIAAALVAGGAFKALSQVPAVAGLLPAAASAPAAAPAAGTKGIAATLIDGQEQAAMLDGVQVEDVSAAMPFNGMNGMGQFTVAEVPPEVAAFG